MKFLIDAQLPARLALRLSEAGHNCIHTLDLPDGNRSTDREIADLADREDRVVVTKDRDFRDSHLLAGSPRRLLVVTTGNIRNDDLLTLFESNLGVILKALAESPFVEIGPGRLVVHRSEW